MNSEEDFLFCLDEKDYKENGTKFEHVAVRAVIKKGEELNDTVIREVKEETGLNVISASLQLIGKVLERRKGEVEDLFEMISYYYEATVEDEIGDTLGETRYETDAVPCVGILFSYASLSTRIVKHNKLTIMRTDIAEKRVYEYFSAC